MNFENVNLLIESINFWRQESISFSLTSPCQVPVVCRIIAQEGYLKTRSPRTTFPPHLYTEFLAPPSHPMRPILQFSDHLGGTNSTDFFLHSKVSVAIDLHFTHLENKIMWRFWELISTLFLERSPQECRSHHSLQKPNAGQNTKITKWNLIPVPEMTLHLHWQRGKNWF